MAAFFTPSTHKSSSYGPASQKRPDDKWARLGLKQQVRQTFLAVVKEPVVSSKLSLVSWINSEMNSLNSCQTNRQLFENNAGLVRHLHYYFGPHRPESMAPNPHALSLATYHKVVKLEETMTAMCK